MKYTQIPTNTFQNLQLNAGILVDSFQPASGTLGNILGATTGGVTFTDNVTYNDFGDDIDNCPKNMMELKKIDSHEVTLAGTFVTVDETSVSMLAGAADADVLDSKHIIPRNKLLTTDFTDIWWIGDYSDVNTGVNAGYLAIHLKNALNTGGFQIRSTDNAKGQFAFSFLGHYTLNDQESVPYEIYISAGTPYSVTLDEASIEVAVGGTRTLTATTVPADGTVTWTTSDQTVATVTSGGVVTGVGAGTANVRATIVVENENYYANCAVTVTASA